MTPLQPLPNPEPNDRLDEARDPDVDRAASRAFTRPPHSKWDAVRRGWRRNPLKEPAVATPAPARLDRAIPAGDIDDRGLRTTWDHAVDGARAATAHLEIENTCERTLIRLPSLIADELELRDELRALQREHRLAEQQLEALQHEVSAIPDSEDIDSRRAVMLLRHSLRRAHRHVSEVILHERRIRRKLARASQEIDAVPDLIYRSVAIIVSHRDVDRDNRVSANPDRYGSWSDPEHGMPSYGLEGFIARYGALPIPSKEEIVAYIQRLRNSAKVVLGSEGDQW